MSELTSQSASIDATATLAGSVPVLPATGGQMPGIDIQPSGRFYWGAATAAYQIEGSLHADGGGRCVWDEFSHTQGNTFLGQTGDVACDHYNRWQDDIDLMRSLGLGAYRFSIRWPRVLPDGVGHVNAKGLAFYDRLVDGLLEAGIEPFVTLFHWDMPAALQRRGGWSNRDIAGWFAEYADAVAQVLGDRVRWWATVNEPFVVAEQGHLVGAQAPGIRNVYAACHAIHNQLRAHVEASAALKARVPGCSVGLAMHNAGAFPATESQADVEAAERAHAWHNYPLFLEPLVRGRYPEAIVDRLDPYLPDGYEADLDALRCPPDFLGMNYYSSHLVERDERSWLGFGSVDEPQAPRTEMDWIIRPEGLRVLLTRAAAEYGVPHLFVTENGAAFRDARAGSTVDDVDRIEYLDAHIAEVLQARKEGAPIDGYFVWSLFDNFEWAYGYDKRFGIVYVDFETQERVVKRSGRWYADLARASGDGGR